MNPLKDLENSGQAVWLDFVAREFVAKGELKKLIDNDGLSGVTSNPSIFEKAIGGSNEYDDAIGKAVQLKDQSVEALYEGLAIEDIKNAADVLGPVYRAKKTADGFVSLEVSPMLAKDTKATISAGERLWKAVGKPNLMIKVPATPEGLPAIRELISKGINVNITLLFSQKVYAQVVDAFLYGLEAYAATGGDLSRIGSVASFFVSRIDTAVDSEIDEKIKAQPSDDGLARLKGKIAVANAKLAYRHYEKIFAGDRWKKLAAKGAHPQRLLWASTGTKNKAYSDVLYVEELIGPDTVNTVPPATLDAFRDHGKVRSSLTENVADAEKALADLAKAGISLDKITDDLVTDGVKLFADAYQKLLNAVAQKRDAAQVKGQRIA
jgi:transaldolase/glucose-6-phosphate isomerase